MIEFAEPEMGQVKVKVVGVGNAGGMIVKRVARERLPGVECGAINTAVKDLGNYAEIRSLQVGTALTRGHGAGMDPQVGRKAALEDANRVRDFLGRNDVLFLVAGFGKGTGTGATPVVAELAKELGALTIAFVTTPFGHERRQHHDIAEEGLREIKGKVDAFVPLSNQRLLDIPSLVSMDAAFAFMDEAILQSIRGIVDVLLRPGRMSLDLADMRTLLKGAGQASVAVGFGKGENRVADVARSLADYPFAQDGHMTASRSLLVSISGGPDLGMREVDELTGEIGKLAEGEPKMALGVHTDEALQGEVRCMIMAAGLTVPVEPEAKDFPLFGDHDASVAVYRPQGWARPGARPGRGEPPYPTRPAGERENAPAREDNVEVPAYLRKGKSGPAPTARS